MNFRYLFFLFFALVSMRGTAAVQDRDTIPNVISGKDPGGFIPLNLKLLDFVATTIDEHTNQIRWDVTGVTVATVYQVERSLDGKEFTVIGSVNSVDGQNSYYFVDDNVSAPANWYRMQAVQEEKTSSSIVVLVKYGQTDPGLSLRPSATNAGSTTLYFGSSRKTSIGLAVIDVSGRMLLNRSFAIGIGGNYIPFDLSRFTTGLYYFRIIDDYGKKTILSFVKL